MLLIFNMVWQCIFCWTAFVYPQSPYSDNDMPIVHCHMFCMWHWSISANMSFIWGHYHLHLVDDGLISRMLYFTLAWYTVMTRPNPVETAVHGCNSWLSVWALLCHWPVKLSALLNCFASGSIFVCGLLHHCIIENTDILMNEDKRVEEKKCCRQSAGKKTKHTRSMRQII